MMKHVVAQALADATGRDAGNPLAHLAASLLLAKAGFLSLVDRGHIGLNPAMAGTPYA